MKWLRFACSNVLRNLRRSLVTVAIGAVGTAAILVGGGFALFTYESLEEISARDSGHLILAHPNYFDEQEDSPLQFGLEGAEALRRDIEDDDRVRKALPRLQLSGLISNGDRTFVFLGTGIDPEEFDVKGPFLKVTAGETLTHAPDLDGPIEVMLGTDLARQLKAEPGATLTLLTTTTEGSLNALDVMVRGVISLGVPEIDKRIALMHLATAQRLLATDKVSTLSVFLRETAQTEVMKGELAGRFPGHAIHTWLEEAFYYIAVRELYNRIFGLLGVIIVVIVLFAVSNTLAMSVVERTREIGTLRALGTLPRQVMQGFALEGMLLGAAGAVLGMVVAAAVSMLLLIKGFQMPPPPGRSVGYPLYVNVSAWLYASTTLIVTLLSTLAALWVSRRAARRPIVEALGHV